ncbi:unnamed protein product [Sphacelaria rigidula]
MATKVRYREREVLKGFEEAIFSHVRERATPAQWANWLRAPLEHAAAAGDSKLVNHLLSAGANAEAGLEGCHGRTLLCTAAKGGNTEVVTALLAAGAGGKDLNVGGGRRKWSALHHAAAAGHRQCCTVLVRAGADADCVDVDGRSPLHHACAGNHEGSVGNLLMGGAGANVRDHDGETPLHIAAARGHELVVSSLLLKGADANAKDRTQRSPLHHAVLNGHTAAAKMLLLAGADATSRYGPYELSPLDVAASLGEVDLLRMFIFHGADANARHPNGMTVLHTAAFNNSTDVVRVLLEAGADIEVRDSAAGSTPLYGAAQSGACDAMRVLLQHGADVDAPTSWGWRPLTVACRFLNIDAVEMLLRWGADETVVDKSGRSVKRAVGRDIPERLRQLRADDMERVHWLLATAAMSRAWRRRGMLVLCRAFPEEAPIKLSTDSGASVYSGKETTAEKTHDTPDRRDSKTSDESMEANSNNRGYGGATTGGHDMERKTEAQAHSLGCLCDSVEASVVLLEQDYIFRSIASFL